MKILIIAYYYPPFKSVGALRPSYWHQRLLDDGLDSYVVTASPQVVTDERVFFVEPISRKTALIKDNGTNWKRPLLRFFLNFRHKQFDVILFTGGPFMHFGIAAKLRKLYPAAKIFLDFRDPFSNNPRFMNSWFKMQIKKFYERKFLKLADEIITVNENCRELLGASGDKCTIIDNGFDERVVYTTDKYTGPLIDEHKINFVYAGSFAKGYSDPIIFSEVIGQYSDRMKFHHIGSENHNFTSIYKNAIKHGSKKYEEGISIMKACDVGLIFPSGHPYESTTKVFDYMACNLDILIVSNLGNMKGPLHQITMGYPNVTWVTNDFDSITDYLTFYKKGRNIQTPKKMHPFSRDAGYKKLLKLLKNNTRDEISI